MVIGGDMQTRRLWRFAAAPAALAALLAASCDGKSSSSPSEASKHAYAPRIRPADFGGQIDNPYFPLMPGSRWVYDGQKAEGRERTVVEVTRDTKTILGISAVVVHDVVTKDGNVKEDTFDWYAQDRQGNVWYLGEDTKEYEDGRVVSTKGSWEAGVKGAQPGIIMNARPAPGSPYRQEYFKGQAEDYAQVLSTRESVSVPAGAYRDVVKTKDFTPLEPKLLEHKYYAPGVGVVQEITVKGGSGRVELVEYTPATA
jgi:hypothetical protein